MTLRDSAISLLDRARLLLARHPEQRTAPTETSKQFDGDQMPGPGRPVVMPDTAAENPRLFDYEYNLNANFQPRTEFNYLPTFFHLHAFFNLNDEARIASNQFIEDILATPYELVIEDEHKGSYDQIKLDKFRRLMDVPDPTVGWGWRQWMRAQLREMVVTDATSVFPLFSKGGDFIAWQLIDGQTIKPIIGIKGGRPMPPDVAYIQYIHGRPYAALAQSELVYYPFRPRVWCSYGESRVEEILSTMARLSSTNAYEQLWFSEGNIPESVALMDTDYVKGKKEEQIAQYQIMLDEITGMTAARRRIFQMPPGIKDVKPVKSYSFNRELPEWLVRLLCVQFGVPPSLFVTETNRATAEELSILANKNFRGTLTAIEGMWKELLRAAGAPEFKMVFRQPRDYSEKATKGVLLLCTTATPDGKALMSWEEGRKELGIETEEEGEPEADDTTPGKVADAQIIPGVAAKPAGAAGMVQNQRPDKQLKMAPAGAPLALPSAANRKTIALKSVSAKSRVAAKMIKGVQPMLQRERARVIKEAVEQAQRRGLKVTGAH